MDGFSRAYRDPKSPLTPITPLSVNNVFSFRLGGDDSLKAWIDQVDAARQKRSRNTCGQQSRSSPRCGTLSGRHSPYVSDLSGASSSTKLPNCISGSAARLVANCILSRISSNSPLSSATANSSTSGNSACGAASTTADYSTASSSASTRTDPTTSHYKSARADTLSSSSCYETACGSASSRFDSASVASTAHCSSQSQSASSVSNLTSSNATCNSLAATPRIELNDQQPQAENAGAASLLEWVVDRLSPSPRKNQPTMTQCLYALLSRFGLEKLFPIFEREEIDMEVFRSLTLTDFILLGITNANDCDRLMDAVAAAFLLR